GGKKVLDDLRRMLEDRSVLYRGERFNSSMKIIGCTEPDARLPRGLREAFETRIVLERYQRTELIALAKHLARRQGRSVDDDTAAVLSTSAGTPREMGRALERFWHDGLTSLSPESRPQRLGRGPSPEGR